MPRKPDVSDVLRKAIKKSDKTLLEIAEATKTSAAQLSRFVRGERSLTLHAVDRLARFFGLALTKARKQ